MAVDKALKLAQKYLIDPKRAAFPGIYGNPKEIAEEAASRVAPENPAMKRLFGVNRDELYERYGNRPGNMEPALHSTRKERGSDATRQIMTKKNANRLIDVLSEAGKHPKLQRGMDAWYAMDPVYDHLEKMVGPDEAKRYYSRLNSVIGMMSAGSGVEAEINRGLAANYLIEQGRGQDFVKYGGVKLPARGPDFPQDIMAIKGHMNHLTSHGLPLQKYMENGRIVSKEAKVPLYTQASGVPETGFQTKAPVPDAHFTRAVGLSDTRGGEKASYAASMGLPELKTMAPWFHDEVAGKMGLESVPAQARLWGAMSGQTGVKTKIGAPKIELLTGEIMRVAKRNNITPEEARDRVLKGQAFKDGGAVTEPTEAQKTAGNYQKTHITFHGLPISIENPKGSVRSGKGWSVKVPYHYGYIKRTQGADGDHVDVCIGPHDDSQMVFIIDQHDCNTGKFDEHKVMLGYRTREQAVDAYRAGFSDGRGNDRLGPVARLSIHEFKDWLKNHDTTKPVRAQGHLDRALSAAKKLV